MKKMIRTLMLSVTALVFLQVVGFAQTQPNAISKKDFYQEKKLVEMQKSTKTPYPIVTESLEHTHFLDSDTGEIMPARAPGSRTETPSTSFKADAPADKTRQPSPKG